MTTKWAPDTCTCIIEHDENTRLTKILQKCQYHRFLDGQALLDRVVSDNAAINLKPYDVDVKENIRLTLEAKAAELKRILEMGPPVAEAAGEV